MYIGYTKKEMQVRTLKYNDLRIHTYMYTDSMQSYISLKDANKHSQLHVTTHAVADDIMLMFHFCKKMVPLTKQSSPLLVDVHYTQ